MKTIIAAISLCLTSFGFCQTAQTPLAPIKEGVYYFQNMYSTTILELKGGQFRYWFSSDMRFRREPTYPLIGQYTTNGSTVLLPDKEIYQTNWTFMTFQGKATLWRPSALKSWDERRRVDPWGVLYATTDKPEEIWERKGLRKISEADIGSRSQEKRNSAAKLLRSSYKPPAKTNWTALVAGMKAGMTKTNLLEMLQYSGAKAESGASSGRTYSENYRLDDAWLLRCAFHYRSRSSGDDTLISAELVERLSDVWVDPPTNFTGLWVTYFVNGNKAREIEYEDGRYSGEFISYHSDGSKAYLQHYNHHIAEGADTGFFRSGRTNYHGLYQTNKQVGTWTWYNEDGTIKTTREYSKP